MFCLASPILNGRLCYKIPEVANEKLSKRHYLREKMKRSVRLWMSTQIIVLETNASPVKFLARPSLFLGIRASRVVVSIAIPKTSGIEFCISSICFWYV